jgi:cyanophycinase
MNLNNLLIIGGSEDKDGECRILNHFSDAAGRENGSIIVLTTATESPEEAGQKYKEVFQQMNIGEIDIMNIDTREDANLLEKERAINKATGFFFTGGDQLRITSILGGTRLYYLLHQAYRRGAIIAGTSAGASAMSSTMIVEGNDNDTARKCTLKMAPGLNFFDGVLIDQHFHQRGRVGRLLSGVAENPAVLGIGIDEDTAIRTYPDGHFDVIGSNAVTIVDGASIKSSNVSELYQDENLAINNVTMHVLPEGYGFDLNNRKVIRSSANN